MERSYNITLKIIDILCFILYKKRMRKNFGSKPYLYPQLVMIIGTYDKDGNPNAMNAAWGGMADYDKVMVCMSSHKTTENIEYTNEFTISIGA